MRISSFLISAFVLGNVVFGQFVWTNTTFSPKSIWKFTPHPPAFTHPRLFFTEADRPDLVQRAKTQNIVKTALATLNSTLASTLFNPSNVFGSTYSVLKSGNLAVNMRNSTIAKSSGVVTGDCNEITGTNCNIFSLLSAAAYTGWLYYNDTAYMTPIATALATASQQVLTWDNSTYLSWTASDLAFAYDLSYNWMTSNQRNTTRKLIADIAAKKSVFHQNPNSFISDQFAALSWPLVISQLSIEGEPGYNVDVAKANCNIMLYGLKTWGSYADGSTRDGMGYESFSMGVGSKGALAMSRANICGNLYNPSVSNLAKSFEQYIYGTAPWGKGVMMGHDDGVQVNGGPGYSAFPLIIKYLFRNDELVDFGYNSWIISDKPSAYPLTRAIFGVDPQTTTLKQAIEAKKLPLTKFFYMKGIAVTYSGTDPDAIKVDFKNRPETFHLGHQHSSTNEFYLFAKQRIWFGCAGYHRVENDLHTSVLIDGKGQAGNSIDQFWPAMPGKWLTLNDTANFTVFAGDAKAAYDYWITINDNQMMWFKYQSPSLRGNNTEYSWNDFWFQPNLMPTNQSEFYSKVQAHGKYNPVKRAFRTLAMIRGERPWVLVVDDIQKDSGLHDYEWIANTMVVYPFGAMDMEIDTNSSTLYGLNNKTDIILYRRADKGQGKPRLLVRVLDSKGIAEPMFLKDYTFGVNDNLQGYQNITTRRFHIPRKRTVSPDFKIMLYPHLSGDSLPITVWNSDKTLIKVTWPDSKQENQIQFDYSNPDNRTRLLFSLESAVFQSINETRPERNESSNGSTESGNGRNEGDDASKDGESTTTIGIESGNESIQSKKSLRSNVGFIIGVSLSGFVVVAVIGLLVRQYRKTGSFGLQQDKIRMVSLSELENTNNI